MTLNEFTNDKNYELFSYQKKGVIHLLSNKKAGLFHSPGLGKTLQTICALQYLEERKGKQKVLIVCPNHLIGTWESEIKKWNGNPNWNIVPYSKITPAKLNQFCNNDVVVWDEVHYLKNLKRTYNRNTKRYNAPTGSGRAKTAYYISNTSTWVWKLSATPYPNVPTELEGVSVATGQEGLTIPRGKFMNVMGVGLKEHYVAGGSGETSTSYDTKHPTISTSALLTYMKNTGWNYMNKTELGLPPKTYILQKWKVKESIKMKKLGEKLISQIKDFGFESIGEFASYNKSCGISKARSSDAKSFLQGIKERNKQEVIFFRHRDVLSILQEKASALGIQTTAVTGGQTQRERDNNIIDFQKGYKQIIFVNIAAAEGMNLQCASNATFFEMPFSLKENLQAQDRVHRIGSTKDVLIKYIITTQMDEHIYSLLEQKSYYDISDTKQGDQL